MTSYAAEAFFDLGEFAQTYFKEILVKHDNYWFRSVRSILGLAHEYGNEAVKLFEKQGEEMFQVKYVRPNLRKQIKEHLCV